MPLKSSGPGRQSGSKIDREGISRVVAEARKAQAEREKTYREQSLKIHPWICARCGREFTNKNLHLLTVHHKDHDHDNNPPDGSNWENLCIYCHENEHRRYLDYIEGGGAQAGKEQKESLTHNPFADLKGLLKPK
ncbi:MAG: HNH nuclease family protein [Deltaproteobacteria bacterium]|nr:HNH nuclease family protein [Deltaproteobacteria bacterium]MBW1728024.1 HNH nuclease family protein [Deltaproteobacteria bacterium]MBW1908643.1 HNH nuclease family protein [Deltaproteobacteria bacterium]MBW2032340.1 HNH nuclease family protein [Deltaproteobacteria bacterium]